MKKTNCTFSMAFFLLVLAGFLAPAQSLVAPPDLTAIGVSPNEFQVSWTDNNFGEDYYEIHYSTSPEGPFDVWTTSAISSDTGEVIVQWIPAWPSTTYYAKVRAVIAPDTYGPFSDMVSTTTQATLPAIPTNFTARAEGNHIRLRWTDNANDEFGYLIVRKVDQTSTNLALLPPNTTEYLDFDVGAGVTYTYFLGAVNEYQISESMAFAQAALKQKETAAAVFPNPFNGNNNLTVEMKNNVSAAANIQVVDLQGVVHLNSDYRLHDNSTITLEGTGALKKGCYYVKIRTDDGVLESRMVVKN